MSIDLIVLSRDNRTYRNLILCSIAAQPWIYVVALGPLHMVVAH